MAASRRLVVLLLAASSAASARADAPPVAKRPAESDVVVERDVKIAVRDGTKLAADVYRPGRDGRPIPGRFPTLLTRTPYGKGDGRSAEARYYAARGYVVVINDVRGRYGSEGTWRLIADDPQDGYDVVEWIARQEWSDGKVGTFGTSYPGGTQHAMAETSPPGLATMVPVDSVSNCAVAGMRHSGAFELRFFNWITTIGAPNSRAAMADPDLRAALVENGKRTRQLVDRLPLRPGDTPLRAVPEYEAWLVEALRSGPESPFWKIKGMSVVDHLADYKDIPVQHVTGWYDSWARPVSMNYEALSKAKSSPQRLLIGPWTHGGQGSNRAGEVEFTPDAAIDLNAFRLRWYDRWLRGMKNGVDDDPPVWIYVMGTGDDSRTPAGRLRHGGSWRAEREWPLRRARPTPFYLHADGTLAEAPPGPGPTATTYTFDPLRPVPTVGGNISSAGGLMLNGGLDQRPRPDTHAGGDLLPLSTRRDVVVFRTSPLAADVEVTGTVVAELFVSTTGLDTDFTAKLVEEVPPGPGFPIGFDLNLGDSILRLRYRDGLDRPTLARPGQVYPIRVVLYPTSNVFKKGHRIRVDVSSSNYPRFDVNPNTGDPLNAHRRMLAVDNTVYHDAGRPSRVVLPVVPRGE